MELKLLRHSHVFCRHALLIVPYGIETPLSGLFKEKVYLLIVPYGIETSINRDKWYSFF